MTVDDIESLVSFPKAFGNFGSTDYITRDQFIALYRLGKCRVYGENSALILKMRVKKDLSEFDHPGMGHTGTDD
jgi:hypothetical protein